MTLCDKSFAKKLAFSYLDELVVEFNARYGTEVGSVARPYAFVKFGKSINLVIIKASNGQRYFYSKNQKTIQGYEDKQKSE